jgi:hypothetical protein
MLRENAANPEGYRPPKSRPLLEQVDLAYRIVVARYSPSPMTWDQIAAEEGIPKRTLQHFFRSWLEGVGAPTERQRTLRPRTRDVERLLAYCRR